MPHFTTRDGVRLYYEEAGRGVPIVFAAPELPFEKKWRKSL